MDFQFGSTSGAHAVDIYLLKNEVNIGESRTVSEYKDESSRVLDPGINNMVLHIDRVDQVELICNDYQNLM